MTSVPNELHYVDWVAGAHTPFTGTILNTLKLGISSGMSALQFFMGNPQSFDRTAITENDITACKKILTRFPTRIFSHFPYVANLAGSKATLAWSGNSAQDAKTKHVLRSLEYELSILGHVSGGVVIHPGNYPDETTGLEAIGKSISKLNFSKGSKLLLENSAGQGTSLATTLEQLQTIIDHTEEEKRKHLGVCIDTCHIFAYGEYDLRETEEVDRLFSEFDNVIGLERFGLLHLNDSETQLGKKVDRHACLGCGYIWNGNFEPLRHLLEKCKKHNIPSVLETCVSDMAVLESIKTEIL